MVITMAKLRMAHASTHGARKHAWRTQAAWAKIHEGPGVVVVWFFVIIIPTPVWVLDLDFDWGVAIYKYGWHPPKLFLKNSSKAT